MGAGTWEAKWATAHPENIRVWNGVKTFRQFVNQSIVASNVHSTSMYRVAQ